MVAVEDCSSARATEQRQMKLIQARSVSECAAQCSSAAPAENARPYSRRRAAELHTPLRNTLFALSFNGKPQAPACLLPEDAGACGLPLNEAGFEQAISARIGRTSDRAGDLRRAVDFPILSSQTKAYFTGLSKKEGTLRSRRLDEFCIMGGLRIPFAAPPAPHSTTVRSVDSLRVFAQRQRSVSER